MVKEIATLYVDGKEFHQNFDYDGMQSMKQRLIDIGIEPSRIKVTSRMPNI